MKIIAALCFIAGVVLACVCYTQSNQIRQLESENAGLKSKSSALPVTVKALEKRVRDADAESQALRNLLANTDAKRKAGPNGKDDAAHPGESASSQNAVALIKHWLEAMDDPEVSRLTALQQKAQIQRRFSPVFHSLALDAQTQDGLTKLLMERKSVALDVAVAMVRSGADPMADPDTRQSMIATQRQQIESQIQQLLGDDQYSAFQAAEQNLGQNNVLMNLQLSLEAANTPLSDAQLAQVQQAMENNHVGHLNDRIANSIMPTLTPAQAQAFSDFYQEQKAARDLRRAQAGQLQGLITPVVPKTKGP